MAFGRVNGIVKSASMGNVLQEITIVYTMLRGASTLSYTSLLEIMHLGVSLINRKACFSIEAIAQKRVAWKFYGIGAIVGFRDKEAFRF